MAQVKKLQAGQTVPVNTPNSSKKRLYRGVEITDEDINQYEQELGRWTRENTNNSGDLRKLDSYIKTIASELGNNADIELNPTGLTRVGSVSATPGKRGTLGTDLNLFGNIRDEQGTALDKTTEFFDKLIEAKKTSTSESSTVTPTQKYHSDLSRTISDRYFGGNWENAQKGIGELTSDKRLAYVKEGLKDSILKYKQEYGEDSKYSNRLSEIDAATPERIKEIAYEMGMDASEYLEGTPEEKAKLEQTKRENDPYYDLRQQGEIIEDDYLSSKGLIGFKDKNGITHLLFKNDLKQQYTDTNPIIETTWGQHYGKGIFYNPTLGYNWGDRNKFKTDTNYYNIAEPVYAQQEAKTKAGIEGSINSIDFNTQFDPTFSILKDKITNKFDYIDATKYFSGLNTGKQKLIIPKNRIKYTSIGDIDLNNLNAYMYDKDLNKNIPVTIKLNTVGSSQAIGNNGKVYDLGIIGENFGNTSEIETTYNTSLGDFSNVDSNTEERLRGRVVGFENRLVNKNNIVDFLHQVNRQNFTDDLSIEEAKNLSNLVKKYYSKYKPALSQQSILNIQKALSKFDNSISDIKTNKQFYKSQHGASSSFKKGGIIKYQVGGGIKSKVSDKVKPLAKTTNPNLGYGSARIGDLNTSTFSDNADMVATGLDALSLAGGPVGVGAGLASTLVQAVGDSNRSGFLSGDMLKNLGINLGFTALAFIPGASAAKIGKIAKTANKLSNATKFIKDTEKAVKVLSKVENLSDDAKKALKAVDMAKKVIADAEKGKNVTKFINKITLNPVTKTAATAARVGFSGLGISTGIESAKNIIDNDGNARISDIRGLVAGFAGARAATGMVKNSLIRKGTELKTPINKVQTEIAEDASKSSKIKAKTSDSAKNISNKTSNFVKEKITDNWENRKLKSDEGAGWLTKLGINQAKKVGFTEDGLGRNINQKLIDVLNNESKLTSKPRLALPEYKSNIVNRPISGKYPVADEPYNPVKVFQQSVNNLLKANSIKNLNTPIKSTPKNVKTNKSKYKKANTQRVKGLINNGLVDESGQVSIKFKQGGQLIPKFQNEGVINDYISGQVIKGGNNDIILKNLPELNVIAEDLSNKSKISTETKFSKLSPKVTIGDSKKANLNLNTGILIEIPKLANALSTNAKNARIMASVKPVLGKMPAEIYKPVVTNLTNENFINNQVTSYLRQASKPITSDASLQKAMQFEAMSKTTPMTIQARAANTDIYNQTLGASKESAEKYNLMRNEVANSNAERLGAHDARIASIYAGKNVANNASWANFFDKSNQLLERDEMYKHQLNTQSELQRLQQERQNKLKPFYEKYNSSINDPKSTNIYKRAEQWHKKFPNKNLEDYTENGKTYSELLALEQSNNQKAYELESEKLNPYYENQFLNLNYKNPYIKSFNIGTYKKGGSIDSKVEIQNLKNKMKAKEMDAKYADKTLDRKQKEVQSILNGLSKESLFLLKTMLGK